MVTKQLSEKPPSDRTNSILENRYEIKEKLIQEKISRGRPATKELMGLVIDHPLLEKRKNYKFKTLEGKGSPPILILFPL